MAKARKTTITKSTRKPVPEAQHRKVISDWRETAFKTVTAEGLFFAAGRAASLWMRRPGGRS
ncbi:MAG TPA: hypothetical protein VKJ01_27165 [Candidatus Solibacter sp.]|jgi:hypothetical protein|nr:hypothetical protein [Candidatus Solibacter sp.]